MIYSVAIYDENGVRVTVLRDVASPTYSRAKNAADQISFEVPRNDVNIPEIRTGRRFEIIKTLNGSTSVEESGYISNHGYSDEVYEVEGFTEEILLTRYLTPAQFGYPLSSENQSLFTLVQQFNRAYLVERVKYNWTDYIVDESNIDYTTEPSFIILQNNGSSQSPSYPSSGFVVFRFQKESNESWERFRWVSDYYTDEAGELTTKVRYRTADDPANFLDWSNYTPQAGAETDVVGIVIAPEFQDDEQFLEVRVDFATDTTEASPVFFALEMIKRKPTEITSVVASAASDDIATPGLDADNASFLDILIAACEPSGYEFKVEDGTLYLQSTFGVDRTNDYSAVAG